MLLLIGKGVILLVIGKVIRWQIKKKRDDDDNEPPPTCGQSADNYYRMLTVLSTELSCVG